MDFKDSHGNLLKGEDSIFPILTKNDKGLFEFLATGFFIGFTGEFVTAKHVVLNDKNKNQPHCPLYIVQSIKGKHFLRYVEYIFPHQKADIVYGKAHNIIGQSNGKNIAFSNTETPFQLSIQELKIDDELMTFSFPNSKIEISNNKEIGMFIGEWFKGKVKEHFPCGRDSIFLPDSCYQTSINILGGSSGGPVINSKSKVVAVNSTGYDLEAGQENISFITPISKILEIQIFHEGIDDTIENHLIQNRINLLL